MPRRDDDRRDGKADGVGSGARPDDAALPAATSGSDKAAEPRGTEMGARTADTGGGEVRATKETPEPDSLGG
jgi:hypothetical protein